MKLVCGTQAPSDVAPVAPGRYWTAVNIHNPDKCRDAHFRWKVVVAPPLNQSAAPAPVFQRPRTIRPDEALEIDCHNVVATFSPPPQFVKGYVVIESDVELDVVAVYTSAVSGTAQINTFHTERVQARCVPVCDDLVLPLHTGIADWQTIAPPPLGPVAVLSGVPSVWAPPPFGAAYVSQSASDSTVGAPQGVLRYQLCFDLCFGFTPPAPFQIVGVADDTADVLLNNVMIGTLLTPTTPPLNVTAAILQSLHAGRNCFEVRVHNVPAGTSPTGFALAGILNVAGGKCPCSRLPIAGRPAAAGPIPIPVDNQNDPT
ncbi:MAG TPA: hypothetical protein VJZ76_15260 [Thermoanaerobaculia bacterium]|nr:hypothetical protein [Thermoanaerobaculia bacterium]